MQVLVAGFGMLSAGMVSFLTSETGGWARVGCAVFWLEMVVVHV